MWRAAAKSAELLIFLLICTFTQKFCDQCLSIIAEHFLPPLIQVDLILGDKVLKLLSIQLFDMSMMLS